MAAVPESTIGQQEGELPVLGYQSALAMVRDCTQGLEQANFLQYASNLGVVMIVYAAVILFKMICISDPEFIAPQSQDVVSLLRRLSDGMLLAAAFQGTKCSTMQHYGEALSRLLGAPASSTEHASVTESSSAQPPLNFDNFRQLVNLFDLS
ncbi:hypothetical protein L486_08285 [Kwoniella mangroviensis CBS 10435]|uniref:Uncharacterized protein n=1 Tax=Kwoniella mangroviensis CBS 10435 TaxID=1331196 RepID=A0A1B9IG06_9TREE|nr:hypothetical protein L486_08285 [Kwoniella mangroviensis CBS 10435]OCF70830.1 hypothetical protein I204_08520 [Kwoniella mangroviensis CBS 8886]